MILDPISAGVQVLDAWLLRRQFGKYFKQAFGILMSFLLTGSFSSGTALLAHSSNPVAVGSGLVAGAGAALMAYLKSDLVKGIQVVIPADLAVAEMNQKLESVKG